MALKSIILKREEHVAVLSLNRPDRLNALNEEMFDELNQVLSEIAEEDDIRVVVLTGQGRAFCAGADIGRGETRERVLDATNPEVFRQGIRNGPQGVVRKLYYMEKPTIAMVNGAAVGAGMGLALACDIRLGSENTRFRVAFTTIGLIPGTADAWFLPRLVGLGQAALLLFSGDFVEAEEAARSGLVNKLVPAAQLEAETMALARRLASNPPLALRLDKELLYRGLNTDLDTALEMAATAQTVCAFSEDHKEGLAAFREKRQPIFKGR